MTDNMKFTEWNRKKQEKKDPEILARILVGLYGPKNGLEKFKELMTEIEVVETKESKDE